MFILSNINLVASQQLFNILSRKFIKFQLSKNTTHTDTSTNKCPFPAKFINNHQVRWDTPLSFKQQFYDKTIPFEIYERHQFGYHQQQFTSVLYGEIKISHQQQYSNCPIYIQKDNSMVGTLTCTIKHQRDLTKQIILKKTAEPQILTIKSIVGNNKINKAHIPLSVNKKVVIKVKVSGNIITTSCIKSISGSLVFPQLLVLNKYDTDNYAIITLQQVIDHNNIPIAEGKMFLKGPKPDKKVILANFNKQIVGEAYIDAFQETNERDRNKNRKSNSMPIHLQKLSPSKFTMKETGRQSEWVKKISVISSNQSIPFLTQKRFKQTHNPQSFHQTRSSKISKKSIGSCRVNKIFNKPHRQLFSISQQQTPGVGRYKLPTIWDKY